MNSLESTLRIDKIMMDAMILAMFEQREEADTEEDDDYGYYDSDFDYYVI